VTGQTEVWAIDAEWGFHGGRIDHESVWEPVLLCAVGLRSGRRLDFWGRASRLYDFVRDHATDIFASHYSPAEMKYLLRLNIPLPERWFDTFVASRFLSNKPGNLEAGLPVALGRLGLAHLIPAAKERLRQCILHLQFNGDNPANRREITDYCYHDCDGCGALYQRTHDSIDGAVMAHWIEYAKAVARMELRGIPLDTAGYARIKAMQPAIKTAMIGNVNATWPVFAGERFKKRAFFRWCKRLGIAWPTTVSTSTGQRYKSCDKDTLKAMENRHPFIAEVRQVRKTLFQFNRRELIVDPLRGRHYFSTSIFRSVTGRNQPRKFIFSAPKWFRFLIVAESPDHVLVYVDFTAEEIGIAAALSGDPAMRAVYEAADCHIAFAVRAGAAPPGATKESHAAVRKQYKTVNLGMQYGQTAYGIAYRLGIPRARAEELVAAHKALFPDFWRWSDRSVQGAYDRGWIKTPCGWRSKVPFLSKEKTWLNWPMQATGSDIMRLTLTYLDRQNVRVLAPVHDGFLLSCRRDQLADLRDAVDYACATAVDHVLPGFPLRWDVTVHDRRFQDEDGRFLWEKLQTIMGGSHVAE